MSMAGRREWGTAARALAFGLLVGGAWAFFLLWLLGGLPGGAGALARFGAPRVIGLCGGPIVIGGVGRAFGGSWRTVAAFIVGGLAGAWLFLPTVIALGNLAAQTTGGRFEL